MLKVTINGEVFSFEPRYPLHERIAIEEGLGLTPEEWNQALDKGSPKAIAGFAYLVLKRAGRDIALADILSGAHEIAPGIQIDGEGDDAAGPTLPSSGSTDGPGSEPSPSGSDSAPATSTT